MVARVCESIVNAYHITIVSQQMDPANDLPMQAVDSGYAFVILAICCFLRMIATMQTTNYSVFLYAWSELFEVPVLTVAL